MLFERNLELNLHLQWLSWNEMNNASRSSHTIKMFTFVNTQTSYNSHATYHFKK